MGTLCCAARPDRRRAVVGARHAAAGAARARPRAGAGQRPDLVRGRRERRLAEAVAAEGAAARRRGRCRRSPGPPSPLRRAKAAVNLKVRRANLAPLFERDPVADAVPNLTMTSRLGLAGSKLRFNDIDGTMAGSRLRGRLAVTLGDETEVEGEFGLDSLELGPALQLAIGASAPMPPAPLGRGLLQGWRGRLAFQALRGASARRHRTAPGQRHDPQRRRVADRSTSSGQDRRRRSQGRSVRAALRRWRCARCPAAMGRRRRRGVALSRPGDAGGQDRAADDAGGHRPQRRGAGGQPVRRRAPDARAGPDCRARSKGVRGRDARRRGRPADRRRSNSAGSSSRCWRKAR